MVMNESEFEELSEAVLGAIERALERAADAAELDLDFERKEGGVLELEFGDGSRMVINRHGAAREIWVAAKSPAASISVMTPGAGWTRARVANCSQRSPAWSARKADPPSFLRGRSRGTEVPPHPFLGWLISSGRLRVIRRA